MTRLKDSDICHISPRLEAYNRELLAKTGRTLLGIACHAYGKNEIQIRRQIESFSIHVVPVTAGKGIITDFSKTVTTILQFMGFKTLVSNQPDISGIAQAFNNKADAVMMADDHIFVGLNLKDRSVADNSEATGRIFAAALDLMAGGIKDKAVLVQGCGPVGESAVRTLLSFGAEVGLYDINLAAARSMRKKILAVPACPGGDKIVIETGSDYPISKYQHIIEATPSINTIKDEQISDHMIVAAPGVPLGISENGCELLKNRLLHDKLELGVAAMAICLL